MATIDTGHVLQGQSRRPRAAGPTLERYRTSTRETGSGDECHGGHARSLRRGENGGTRPLGSGVSGDPITMQMETEDLEFGGEIDRPAAHTLRRLFDDSPNCGVCERTELRPLGHDGAHKHYGERTPLDDPLAFAVSCWLKCGDDMKSDSDFDSADLEDADAAWLDDAIAAASATLLNSRKRTQSRRSSKPSGATRRRAKGTSATEGTTPRPKAKRSLAVGFTQPRGRPPHDADGTKMRWDTVNGQWVSAKTGVPRTPLI